MYKRLYILITAIILTGLFVGCATESPVAPPHNTEVQQAEAKPVSEPEPGLSISLIITSDFGKNVMFEEAITVKQGATAMDALTGAVQVETKHGGGFVSAINNTGSEYEKATGKKRDWFFYMNGIASNIIDNGKGNALTSVYMVNIIGTTNSIDSGPTNAWAPLTSSAKTDNEIANAKDESSAINTETPIIA